MYYIANNGKAQLKMIYDRSAPLHWSLIYVKLDEWS